MTDDMINERISKFVFFVFVFFLFFFQKWSSMVSAAAFAVWLCGSDVRSFVTMILFSAAIEDALSNKRRKYIFTNITHCINQNPKLNMSFYQITGNCVECNRQRSYIPEYKFSNYSNYWNFKILKHWFVRGGIRISTCFVLNFLQEPFHSTIVLQKTCQNVCSRGPPGITKCQQTTLFLVENTLLLVI